MNFNVDIFDESIYSSGIIFEAYQNINVFNKADEFLLKRFYKRFSRNNLNSCVDIPKLSNTINVNQTVRCGSGVNLYTIKSKTPNTTP
jgi:hypothetical protein